MNRESLVKILVHFLYSTCKHAEGTSTDPFLTSKHSFLAIFPRRLLFAFPSYADILVCIVFQGIAVESDRTPSKSTCFIDLENRTSSRVSSLIFRQNRKKGKSIIRSLRKSRFNSNGHVHGSRRKRIPCVCVAFLVGNEQRTR